MTYYAYARKQHGASLELVGTFDTEEQAWEFIYTMTKTKVGRVYSEEELIQMQQKLQRRAETIDTVKSKLKEFVQRANQSISKQST